MKKITYEDYTIFIGSNAVENWELIKKANQRDIWLHVDCGPSPHVIIEYNKSNSEVIPRKIIHYAAVLCKENSKYSDNKALKIIYTDIKNVKLSDIVGQVTTRKSKMIIV